MPTGVLDVIGSLDAAAFRWLRTYYVPAIDVLMAGLSDISRGGAIWCVLSMIVALLHPKRWPAAVQVLLVVVVGMSMAAARARAVKTMDRQRGNPDLAMGRVAWPDDAAKRAASYRNQFEGPVLFYAVVAFALITKGADTLMIVLAWLFVLTRIVHAAIHIGPNKVRWRSPAFALGFLIVVLMWIKLAVHVATAGLA